MRMFFVLFFVFCSMPFISAQNRVQVENGIDSIAYFTQLIEKDRGNVDWYMARAYLHYRNDDYKLALRDVNKGLRFMSEPNDTFVSFRAGLYVVLGKNKKAMSDFEYALRLNPSPQNLFALGHFQCLMGEYSKSVDFLSQYIDKDGRDGAAYYYRGISHAKLESGDTIVYKDLKKATLLLENDTSGIKDHSYYELAYYFHHRENYDSALFNYQQVLDFGSSNFDLFDLGYMMGHCYFLNGQYDKAIAVLEKDNLEKNRWNVLYLLARSYEYEEKYDIAEVTYTDIIENRDKENISRAVLHRGICRYHLSDYEYSEKDLIKSKKKWFNDAAIVYYYLGLNRLKQGDNTGACDYFNQALTKKFYDDANMESQIKEYTEICQ